MKQVLVFVIGLMLALIASGQSAQAASPVVLIEKGQARATIIVDSQSLNYTQKAAQELQDYVRQISGATLPIESDPAKARGARIWVGNHAGLAELAKRDSRLNVELDESDEVLLFADGQDVVIRGKDIVLNGKELQVGTYLAAQRFFMEQLGVRWLWPGELGTDIPKQNSITIEPFFQNYAPQIKYRRIRGVEYEYRWRGRFDIPGVENDKEYLQKLDENVRTWLNHHAIEGRMSGRADGVERPIIGESLSHATGHYFSHWHEKYYKDHPEWFALQPDGTRGTYPPKPQRVKICVSNPEVLEQYVKEAIAFFNAHPETDVMGIAPNDHGWLGYCVCKNCEAWDSPNAYETEQALGYANDVWIKRKAITDRKARFWNMAARRVKAEFPDRNIRLLTYAYNAYRTPPVDTELEDNIILQFEGLLQRHRPLNTEENIAAHKELWLAWAKKAKHIVWRPNLRMDRPGDPYVLLRKYGETMNFMAKNNISGIDIDTMMTNNWASHGPHYYLAAAMVWRPDADYRVIMDDYYARGFGPAAEPIKAYYQLFEDLYNYLGVYYPRWSPQRHLGSLYRELRIPPAEAGDTMKYLGIPVSALQQPNARPIESRAAELLDEARRLAQGADPVYLKRIEFVSAGLAFAIAHIDTLEAIRKLRSAPNDPQLRQRANDLYQAQHKLLMEKFDSHALNWIAQKYWEDKEPVWQIPPDFLKKDKPALSDED